MSPEYILHERMRMYIKIYNLMSCSSVNAREYPAKQRTCLVDRPYTCCFVHMNAGIVECIKGGGI